MNSPKRKFTRRKFLVVGTAATLGTMIGCKKDDDFPEVPNVEEPIIDPEPVELPENYRQAIVIGTGFGGAVTALRLGQAGIEVTMLERGKRWDVTPESDTFSSFLIPDKRSTWLRNSSIAPVGPALPLQKHVGVLERIDYEKMKVYNGACVGGGSVVYGGITIQPKREYFEQVFPSEISYDELDNTYYPLVRQMLNATPIPQDLYEDSPYFQYTRVGKKHADKIGVETEFFPCAFDWDIIRQEISGEIPSSAIEGDVIYGVNSGAKNSLDRNYLPMAEQTGNVTIEALHQVKDITKDENNRYQIDIEVLNESGEVVETKQLVCDYLFMAAGSIGSTRLLMRAREKGNLPKLSSEVGKGWGQNGAAMISRSLLWESTGTKQSTPPNCVVLDFDNPVTPTVLELANYPTGFDSHSLIHLALSLSDERGHFTYNSEIDDIELQWQGSQGDVPKAAIEDLIGRLNQQNGGISGSLLMSDTIKDLTYHPLGGVVMGEACDFYGRLKGYENLYVIDGSMIPGSGACANPSLTIAALAERNIKMILEEDFV
ncbi:MAG: GMC oxidoreductase [Chitinophagales bacterium]